MNSCQQAEKRTGESTKKRPPATRCKKVKQCVSLFSLNAILCLGPWTSPGVFLCLVNYVRWDFPQFQSPQVPNSASFIFLEPSSGFLCFWWWWFPQNDGFDSSKTHGHSARQAWRDRIKWMWPLLTCQGGPLYVEGQAFKLWVNHGKPE